MGSGRCVLAEEVFLLSLLLLVATGVSSLNVCPVTESSLILRNSEILLVPATEDFVTLDIALERCGIEKHVEIDFKGLRELSRILTPKIITGQDEKQWFLIKCKLASGVFYVHVVEEASFLNYEVITDKVDEACQQSAFNITSNSIVKFAKLCNESDAASPSNIWNLDAEGETDGDLSYLDDTTNTTSGRNWRKWFDMEREHRNYQSSFRGGHIIFIPIGAIIFLLSVCVRCCLCRRKKIVQQVRTVTVVRRIPAQSSSTSIPEFVNVGGPSAPYPMDLPPSYSDIENEMPPPAFSELENVNEVAGRSHVPTAEEAAAPAATAPVEGNPSKTDTRSTLSRVLTAGSRRSLKSQFSFKPMKEED